MVVFSLGHLSDGQKTRRYYWDNETSAWFGIHRMNDDGDIIVGRGHDENGYWVEVLE